MSCIIHLNRNEPDTWDEAVFKAAEVFKNGGLVVFPTETVYGIGCDAMNDNAVMNLFCKKQRPRSKALLLHLHSLSQASQAAELSETAYSLLKSFTPGPLSVIVPKKECISNIVSAEMQTVGLRFPSDPIFVKMAESFPGMIAATSANISGYESAKNGEEIRTLASIADLLIDAGTCQYSLESTIVSVVDDSPKILRQGAVSRESIEGVIGKCL